MINSDKIAYQVFDAIDNDLFLPINNKIRLEYLDSNMDGVFENERSWRSFINGNFSCKYDKNSWRDDCKLSTIKKWAYAEKEYKHLFVVKTGKDSYTKVSPEDINLKFDYQLLYSRESDFPIRVELYVIATIKD